MSAIAPIWMDLLSWLTDRAREGCVFRGHADDRWSMIPSVGRGFGPPAGKAPPTSGMIPFSNRRESQVLDEFRRLGIPHAGGQPQTQLEWLALAQHYGAPTRLLDWSSNPLVSAWFATSAEPHAGASVIAIKPPGSLVVAPEELDGKACFLCPARGDWPS